MRIKPGRPKIKKRPNNISDKALQWEQMKQQKQSSYIYFGKSLDKIAPAHGSCPVFVEKAIKFVEANGKFFFSSDVLTSVPRQGRVSAGPWKLWNCTVFLGKSLKQTDVYNELCYVMSRIFIQDSFFSSQGEL